MLYPRQVLCSARRDALRLPRVVGLVRFNRISSNFLALRHIGRMTDRANVGKLWLSAKVWPKLLLPAA